MQLAIIHYLTVVDRHDCRFIALHPLFILPDGPDNCIPLNDVIPLTPALGAAIDNLEDLVVSAWHQPFLAPVK